MCTAVVGGSIHRAATRISEASDQRSTTPMTSHRIKDRRKPVQSGVLPYVSSGRRWIDPPGGHKNQRGKRPKKHHADDKPSNKGSEEAGPKRCLAVCVQRSSVDRSTGRPQESARQATKEAPRR